MKIFADTANLKEIELALKNWWIDGVTTNPSLLAKEPKGKFEEHVAKIIEILNRYNDRNPGCGRFRPDKHLSIEVFSRDPDEILRQAGEFRKNFDYQALSIKVQVGWKELDVINELTKRDFSVNCTACMTVSQAVWAAKAGAEYVSLFWGRIRDWSPEVIAKKIDKARQANKHDAVATLQEHFREARRLLDEKILTEDDFNPHSVMQRARAIFEREKFTSQIIAGSMRTVWDIRDAALAGAHIVTVPPKFFPEFSKMTQHFKTDEVVDQFMKDFDKWMS